MTYFELFDIEPTFHPDFRYLRKKFYALSREFHPDHHGEGDTDGVNNIELSAHLNAAYKTLRDSDLLTNYILEMEGVLQPGEKEDANPIFLLEMMELNEDLEDKMSSGKKKDVKHVHQKVEKLIKKLETKMEDLQARYNPDAKNQDLLMKIKESHFKRRYLLRLLEKIDNFATL